MVYECSSSLAACSYPVVIVSISGYGCRTTLRFKAQKQWGKIFRKLKKKVKMKKKKNDFFLLHAVSDKSHGIESACLLALLLGKAIGKHIEIRPTIFF